MGAAAALRSDGLLAGWGQDPRAHMLTLLPLPAAHMVEDTSNLLQHVKFQSSNFENILTWDSGLESAPDTVYSVEYKRWASLSTRPLRTLL